MVGGIDSAARSDVGTHRSPSRRNDPPSTSIENNSSMNSGLPCAAVAIRSRTCGVSAAAPVK
jgi:hypothetical protein